MNIQQVKGEVGDGEDDITEESLTKYEAAAKSLGVSLKEVKDGVTVLRNPMEVLNDLAEAFNKEADDSIKKANLINALGGKYRGNQLAALLSNWETYKSILEDFNSDKALGSAVRESQKDVASWTGQVNILKNNWDEFINSIVNSNDAINVLKALNGILDKLQGTSEHIGGLGTVSTLIAALAGFKGAGVGSSLLSLIQSSKTAITVQDVAMLRQYNALLTNGASVAEAEATALNQASAAAHNLARSANGAAVSEEVLARAENKVTLGAKAAAVATKVLGTALNMAFNVAVVAVISLIVKKISELINEQKELEQQANELRQAELERVEKYQDESDALNDLVAQYVEIISSTNDFATKKEQLLELQEQLPDSYKNEADGIDLVNNKITENIKLLDEQKRKRAEEYVQNNQGAYEVALKELNTKSDYQQSKNLTKFLTGDAWNVVLSLSDKVNAINATTGVYGAHIVGISGTLEEQVQALELIRNEYQKIDGYSADNLVLLDAEIYALQEKVNANKAITYEMEKQKGILTISDQEYNMIEQATQAYREYQLAVNNEDNQGQANALKTLYGIRDVVYSLAPAGSALRQEFDATWNTFNIGTEEALSNIDALKADFDKFIEETYSEESKNLKSIETAINTFLEDGTISHEDAWALFDIDTEKVLTDIQIIDGQYKLSTDQLVKLMQQRIEKQKESIKQTKIEAEEQLALAKAKLASYKVNSFSDAKYYAAYIQEAADDITTAKDMMEKCNYLLAELDGRMASVERLTDQTAKNLNAQVKALEAEVDAIDDTLDSLNDRKDILNEEKDTLQEQLDILNEQKEAIEDTIKSYDAAADAIESYIKKQTDAIQEQIDAMEESVEAIKKDYNDQIDSLEEQNNERDDAIKKEKALADLQNAQNQKKRVYSAERGWEWQSSKEDILQAQKQLADIENEQKIKALGKERDAKLAEIDDYKEVYELQIKAFEEYAQKYSDIASNIKQTENELLAEQILGADWREKLVEEAQSSIATLSGGWGTFKGLDIAFSPVLKTPDGTEVLDNNTISDYINEIIQKARSDISAANILALDSKGLDVNGKTIKNIIADVGETAEQTSQIIRYVGKNGVYNLISDQIGNVTSTLNTGIEKVLETDDALLGNAKMLNKFETEYKEYNNQLNSLVNNEIKNLQDSIDMKDKEIKKIDDEIKAYNKYKKAVETSLKEAQTELENYKKSVDDAKTTVIDSVNDMAEKTVPKIGYIKSAFGEFETSMWENSGKICGWIANVIEAFDELKDSVGSGAVGALGMGLSIIGSHSKGGVVDYTGLAMLHGSKSNPETVFNAADSAKLYELVHNTPNLIASLVQQSAQNLSKIPSLNSSSTNASINVSIGQIVANNPQELTRNLDTHLDSYFRRKLTQSYVQ